MFARPTWNATFFPLWLTYVVVPLAAGLDKFFYLLADWDAYIAPFFARMLPFDGRTFMIIVGVVELVVGAAALTRFRRIAAYVAAAWLMCIAINLVIGGFYDIAVRDVAIAVGAFTLGQMLGLRGQPLVGSRDDGTVATDNSLGADAPVGSGAAYRDRRPEAQYQRAQ